MSTPCFLVASLYTHFVENVCLIAEFPYPQHIYSSSPDIKDSYSQLLLARDRRLSLAVEETLREVILADVSDYGVDLAVGKFFLGYAPGAQRWKPLHDPNTCWIICETKATLDQPPQTVYIDLNNGQVRVAGQPLGGLPSAIGDSPECQQILRDVQYLGFLY